MSKMKTLTCGSKCRWYVPDTKHEAIVRLLLTFMFTCVFFAPVRADVVIDNGTFVNTLAGLRSERVGQQIADDFVVINGNRNFNDAHWWGIYEVTAPVPPGDDFTIRIFRDDGGKPQEPPLHEVVVGNDVGRTDTGVNLVVGAPNVVGADIFEYWADFATITLADEGKYWLSIINDTPNSPNDWAWSQTNTGVGTAHRPTGGSWTASPEENMAFNLTRRPETVVSCPPISACPVMPNESLTFSIEQTRVEIDLGTLNPTGTLSLAQLSEDGNTLVRQTWDFDANNLLLEMADANGTLISINEAIGVENIELPLEIGDLSALVAVDHSHFVAPGSSGWVWISGGILVTLDVLQRNRSQVGQ